MNTESEIVGEQTLEASTPFGHVLVGMLLALEESQPMVAFSGAGRSMVKARTIIEIRSADIGSQVLLSFEGGDAAKPIILGRVVLPEDSSAKSATPGVELDRDGETLVVTAKKKIVMRCGESSITLTEAGKVIIDGEYVVTKSKGVNRIKGASVQIN